MRRNDASSTLGSRSSGESRSMTASDGMEYQRSSYDQKLNVLPKIIAEWLRPHGGVDGKDILDFGCGEATTAIGLTLKHAPRAVFGVDIMPDVHMCLPLARQQLRLDSLPGNLYLRQIQPGQLDFPNDSFDLVYSWSVFEHVDRDIMWTVLQDLRRVLRPSGYLLIQIAPLYYSSEGSHLNALVPEPWGHLTNQLNTYQDKLRAACPDEPTFSSLWSTYSSLNRLTASELIDLLAKCHFCILRQHTTSEELAPPQSLLHAYDPGVLTTNQVVLLAAHLSGSVEARSGRPTGRRFQKAAIERTRGLLKRVIGARGL
jgi:SAM-dependent methyltransferase